MGLKTLVQDLDVIQLMEEAAETRVMVIGPFADAARPQRCQIVEKILAREAQTAWRNMSDSLLHLPSSGNQVNAIVVGCDAVVASGNVGGDLVKLEERKGLCNTQRVTLLKRVETEGKLTRTTPGRPRSIVPPPTPGASARWATSTVAVMVVALIASAVVIPFFIVTATVEISVSVSNKAASVATAVIIA